jgi:outer membrane protein
MAVVGGACTKMQADRTKDFKRGVQMNKITNAWIGALLVLVITSQAVVADEIIPPAEQGHPLILGLGVSYYDRGYDGYDNDKMWRPIPLVMWENEKFFIRATSAGWKLLSNETWEVAAIVEAIGYGYDSDDADILEGMDDRDLFVGAGAHAIYRLPSGLGLKATWVADVANSENGYEMRGEVFYTKKMGDWLIRPSASVVFQSDDTVNYYYGVETSEAVGAIRPAYKGDSTVNYRIQATVGWNPGASRWQLFFGARAEFLGNEIEDSPIMDGSSAYMGFLGAGYRF